MTDFNIAVHFTDRRPLTSVAGSMAYMGQPRSLSLSLLLVHSLTRRRTLAAPEVLAKRGYFATVDWWSLGVVAYELLFGKRPYRGKTNSTLTQAILKDQVRFPDNADEIVSQEGLDCLRGVRPFPFPLASSLTTSETRADGLSLFLSAQFLQRDPKKRLGCPGTGGLEALKRHPWFHEYDWDILERKEATPPFEPDVRPLLLCSYAPSLLRLVFVR